MKRITLVFLLLVQVNVHAGQLGTSVPWISGSTAEGDLVLNNDDYTGEFADNPNQFKINEEGLLLQSIVSTERVIPTIASGGITEYAISLGGGYSNDDASPGVNFDSVFQIQLGFGTGENFVRASDVVPDLRFDQPGLVNPPIEDIFFFVGDIPIMKLIDHQTDTLVYQGSSTSGAISEIEYVDGELFMLPLDMPDLPETVRDLYTADALAGLAAGDIPFTIRVGPVAVPEPSTGMLAVLACLLGMAVVRRKHILTLLSHDRRKLRFVFG